MYADRLREALVALERRWTTSGAPLAIALAPGRTPEEVEARLAEAGLVPSDELLVWFGWHDGAARSGAAVDVGPAQTLLSLDEALAHRDMELELAAEFAAEFGDDPPDVWAPEWLPVVRFVHGGAIAAACGTPRELTSPVWRYEPERLPGRRLADNLAEMVEAWMGLLASGVWRWDADKRTWAQQQPQSAADPLLRFAT